jgi:nucleoside-diphosphate-sugar epimerase
MVQTILGSGGAISTPLARELKKYTDKIRLVSRNPKKVNDTDELFPADALNFLLIDQAIRGSEVVYVTIGFEYNTKVWQRVWPAFMQTVISSCIAHNAKLVFFDNVYLYAREAIPHMTEESPMQPSSRKGAVRKQVHEMIFREVRAGRLTALIARAADFYGPENRNSILDLMVAQNLQKGKKAQAFGDVNCIHTFIYTPDAAIATALLGNTPDAYNQVWHLPTTKEKLSTRDWINLVAKELQVSPRLQVVPDWLVKTLGLFIPLMREFPEMLYQYDRDYIFDSSKFEKRFGITATKPAEGVRAMFEKK